MTNNKSYSGKGNANITHGTPLLRGDWELKVWSNNGNVVAKLSLTNGVTIERRFNLPSSGGAFPEKRPFQIEHDCPTAKLKVSASPNTDWEVTLSLVSAASPVDANNEIQEKESMQTQPPEYVCVNIVDDKNDRLNVRSGPGYTDHSIVSGGDRDKGGGAVPGTRYKVVRTVTDGELVSGNRTWHEIEFNGKSGWVSEFYVDPC